MPPSTLVPLHPTLQPYAWGGTRFLADLLNRPNPDGEPMAELWLGTHPKGPAEIVGQDQTLDQYVADDPERILGKDVVKRFGGLPFLLKILDVKDMLSIQVHPTKEAAEIGFAREEENGPDRSAPDRNYRDDNHKPELGVALTDFYLLHGFRSEAAIRETLNIVPGWAELEKALDNGGVKNLYRHVMEADRTDVNRLLQPLVDSLGQESDYTREQPEFWARRAVSQYSEGGNHDRGLFSIFWFNVVHLKPGEGIYQDAGIPHAYLEGVCVELMANSDNVLRGGLTPKHIDVPELLDKTRFEAVTPEKLTPTDAAGGWQRYPTPAPDFQLYRANLDAGETLTVDSARGPEILLLLDGAVEETNGGPRLDAGRRAAFVPAGVRTTLQTGSETVIYRAGVGA